MEFYTVNTRSKRSSQYVNKITNCLNNASSCKTNKRRDREMVPRKNWISTAIIISCKKKRNVI